MDSLKKTRLWLQHDAGDATLRKTLDGTEAPFQRQVGRPLELETGEASLGRFHYTCEAEFGDRTMINTYCSMHIIYFHWYFNDLHR